MRKALLSAAFACAVALSTPSAATERAGNELDLRPLGATPLECMRVKFPELPDISALCSTTLQRIGDARFESPVPAWVVQSAAYGPVVAIVLANNLSTTDHLAIGKTFETAARCVWDREQRVVRVGEAYAAMYTAPLAGVMQAVVAVMSPLAAGQQFGGDGEGVGTCKPAI